MLQCEDAWMALPELGDVYCCQYSELEDNNLQCNLWKYVGEEGESFTNLELTEDQEYFAGFDDNEWYWAAIMGKDLADGNMMDMMMDMGAGNKMVAGFAAVSAMVSLTLV